MIDHRKTLQILIINKLHEQTPRRDRNRNLTKDQHNHMYQHNRPDRPLKQLFKHVIRGMLLGTLSKENKKRKI